VTLTSTPPSLRSIAHVADDLGIAPAHLRRYGDHMAKVAPAARASGRAPGRLVLVSAITPTRWGEGKTTTSIGLVQGLARRGERACAALREPSMGPVFGVKGGGTGGGRCRLEPSADIDLHFTGDMHAVGSAHNLLAALVDNHLHRGNALGIDLERVHWRRVLDMNDRALRSITTGLGGAANGPARETGFDITPASEVMAALCLAEDAEDLRGRLGRMVVASTSADGPVTAADLDAVGAMLALLRDALQPNLVQTTEGVPALVHGGPFANIAHGCSSVMATKLGLACADWVVTEAGFGMDLGAEKFFDITCAGAGLDTAAVVLVATVRALKHHGGAAPDTLVTPDPAAVERGLANLTKHVETIRAFGERPIVALNRHDADTADELDVVRRACEALGAPFAVSDAYARGGEGALPLAEAVIAHAERTPAPFRPLYLPDEPFRDKLYRVARTAYGADAVIYSARAERDLERIGRLGYGHLPPCVAKTPASLSDDPEATGRPEGFCLRVREVVLAAGAGYLVPITGDVLRMPGLPRAPRSAAVDLVDGRITGLDGS
jgi:formate--tetrahydrofolate ligase